MTWEPPAPLDRAQVREVDRLAVEELGLPGIVLMENAGLLAALELERELSRAPRGPVAVVAGAGNNGGDGYVVARQLALRGVEVSVWATRGPGELSGDARTQRAVADAMGLGCADLAPAGALTRAREEWARSAWVVDALLGTGFGGALRDPLAGVVAALNEARAQGSARVASLDLPSGMDADRGLAPGSLACVRADLTLTFVAAKIGFATPGAERWTGEVRVLPIGVPPSLVERARARFPRA